MKNTVNLSVVMCVWLLIFELSTGNCRACTADTCSTIPLIRPAVSIRHGVAFLKVVIIKDTLHAPLSFAWASSAKNPAFVTIDHNRNGNARAHIPQINGEYYITLTVTCGTKTEKSEVLVTRNEKQLKAFDIQTMKASWISKAILYQVTPNIFVKNAKYPDIEAKLPDLADLGINTIYLQPVFKTHRGGQGYDITDYFGLREDLGTEAQLRSLIQAAKSLNIRVLFDMVPNHTSIHHPYALDKINNGQNSSFYDFYQRSDDGAMYSSHYHYLPEGFICYFWKDLVNLNYDNEKVQTWIIDACKYWVKKFDIDGYRFDAVWAVNARCPSFGKRLQLELKSMKPGLLLIAEDKASSGTAFRQGFDAAYDWTKDTNWVSQWSWQYEFDKLNNHTIFNHPSVVVRKQLLRKALFDNQDRAGLVLRFLENNDMHRFISNHSPEITKMAATLLFSLPGLPMLYNGQEIGFKEFPYRSGPIFKRDTGIRSLNHELFDFYKQLISIRQKNSALAAGTMKEVPVDDSGVVAFSRNSGSQVVLVLINMAATESAVTLTLPGLLNRHGTTRLRDLVSGDVIGYNEKQRSSVSIPVNAYTTRLLLLDLHQ